MKNLIFMLMFTLLISPKVWGNDLEDFNINSFYNVKFTEMSYVDNLYSRSCTQAEKSFTVSNSMSLTKKDDCFSGGFHERSFMFNYHINKRTDSLALTYNTLSIGVAFDTRKIDLGNGEEITVYKPRLKANFSGDIDPGYFFTGWKLTINSTSMRKLQDRYLPQDPMLRDMFRDNLSKHNFEGSSIKGRIVVLELQLYFGG